jgi:DNA-binding GntR family transcriptional regulator
MLEPLPGRKSASKEVYLRLREAIVSGAFAPDMRLYEQRLAADLGVSRTPVREALAMLDAEELVVSENNRGTVVRRISLEEVQENYEVRAVVEGYAARLAAGRISRGQLDDLRALDEEMKQAISDRGTPPEQQVTTLGRLNAEFHQIVATAAGNRVLARTVQFLLNTPLYARAYHAYADLSKRASIFDHDRMIELFGTGDGDAGEQFWREHLYRGRDYMIEHLDAGESGR